MLDIRKGGKYYDLLRQLGGVYEGEGYPEWLLKAPHSVRTEFFDSYCWAAHPMIEEAAEELLRWILEPAGVDIINVIGPTGVGKSTLMKYLIKKLYEAAVTDLESNPGLYPAAYIEAQNPLRGSYDWGGHFVAVLRSLNEVLIDKKRYLPDPSAEIAELKAIVKRAIGGLGAQRQAAMSAILNRIIYAFFVDEAQLIAKGSDGDGVTNQADIMRSFAAGSQRVHVLFGTYGLVHLRNLNGQLGRRSHTIHFRRYDSDVKKDVAAFASVFDYFQGKLPLRTRPVLSNSDLEYCYLRTLGCVGQMKDWFRRCLVAALADGLETVDSKLFRKKVADPSVCKQIADEIAQGEKNLMEEDEVLANDYIKKKLRENKEGMKAAVGAVSNESKQDTPKQEPLPVDKGGEAKNGRSAKKGGKKNGQPFQCKEKRLPTGTEVNAA